MKSIAGGALIGLGGAAFLSVGGGTLGAFLFSLGLYSICATGQLLLTGRSAYTYNVTELARILAGNAIGACGMGAVISFVKPGLREGAQALCQGKLNEGGMMVVAAVLCNILIYLAVEGYRQGHPMLLVMCVMAFILCGFEHSIANMFYFSVAGMWGLKPICFILINIMGNMAGGWMVLTVRLLARKGGNGS